MFIIVINDIVLNLSSDYRQVGAPPMGLCHVEPLASLSYTYLI